MTSSTSLTPITQRVARAGKDLLVFSKLERIIAAVCMAIPFFLIMADQQQKISLGAIFLGTAIIMVIPLIVAWVSAQIKRMDKQWKGVLAFLGALLFIGGLFYFWWVVVLPDGLYVKDSISAYVAMTDAHLFGLLLTLAATLFIFNGAIYINKPSLKAEKKSGRWYNLVLGIALLCVVLFPCTNPDLQVYHYSFAILFFAGSAVVIAVYNDQQHRWISRCIAALTVVSFLFHFINGALTLFWAEAIGLWVIGMHYMLESLGELT